MATDKKKKRTGPIIKGQILTVRLVRQGRAAYAPGFSRAADVYARMAPYFRKLTVEEFWVVLCNIKNQITGTHQLEKSDSDVIGSVKVSQGTLDASLVHPRDVFKAAVVGNAASVLCVHNHPSGDPEPSPEDVALTRRLAEAGQLMGIPVLDHIVIGAKGFVSLAERGVV